MQIRRWIAKYQLAERWYCDIMATATNRSLLLLLVLMPVLSTSFILSPVSKLSLQRSIISLSAIDDDNNSCNCNPSHQQDASISRFIIASILATAPFVSWNIHVSPTSMILPPMAYALQERNEALWWDFTWSHDTYDVSRICIYYLMHHLLLIIATLAFLQMLALGTVRRHHYSKYQFTSFLAV